MGNLALTVACGPYDRMAALANGIVQAEGIDVTYLGILSPPEIFARMVKTNAFDLCEMSLAMYFTLRSKGEFPFIALPVFPARVFRHAYIFVNKKCGISKPKDLEGKRVGVQEYRQTAATWIRGILQHEYDVNLSSISWVEGGVNVVRAPDEQMDLRPAGPIDIQSAPPGKSINELLQTGEVAAYFGARRPASLDTNPDVQRMFPNYREVETAYFRKTGIFPIMHTMVVRKDLYQRHPWIAESMFKAFQASKKWGLEHMRFSGTMVYMVPWLNENVEVIDELFSGDPYPYGVEPNRSHLETLLQFLVDQDFVAEPCPKLEELFTPIVGWAE